MKNYYEILEISQNASQEIVDKAYKVLVKKYHPDLQTDANEKIKCEAKIKEINEAYEILSDNQKRAEYDESCKSNELKREQYNTEAKQTKVNNANNNINRPQDTINYNKNNDIYAKAKMNEEMRRQRQEAEIQYQNAINRAYRDAYIRDLKNRGYKIKYKKTLNDYIHSLIALLITIGVLFLIFQIPFVKNYFASLYNDNEVIRGIVDTITGIFK